jgi:hypothetical protein
MLLGDVEDSIVHSHPHNTEQSSLLHYALL